MIGTLGEITLALGLATTVGATVLWLRLALSGGSDRPARVATWATLAAAALACALLEWALVAHDFSVSYVAENGGREVPLYFTVTSLWAALDGSLLLWLLILGGFGALLTRTVRRNPEPVHHWAMTVLSVVAVFFFALTYFAANPFRAVTPVPADGPGPNPLLREHAAMGVHPPLLYLGYIGMIVPFAYAVAALVTGRAGADWLAFTRRWTLTAWSCLTAGIVLGAWWSYAVLGWGGYWAWDPVENASLLPWLTAIGAVHVTLLRGRRARLTGWAVALHSLTFLLVLVGTFLTRSGAVASVHSFTNSPLGPMLLGFVLVVAATVTGLLIRRAGRFGGADGPLWSLRTAVLANVVLFTVLAAVVLTGTVFPLIAQGLTGTRTAVGAAYFNRTAVPVALAVLLVMGAAPLVRPRGDRAADLARRLALPAAAGLVTIAVTGLFSRPGVLALCAFGVAAFVLTGLARLAWTERGGLRAMARRRRLGGLLAHAGITLAAVGIAASSAYTASAEAQVGLGEAVSARGVTARLVGVDRAAGDGRMTAGVRLRLERDGAVLGILAPKLHYYPARDLTVGVPDIRSRPGGDLYTTVTGISQDGTHATIRLAVNPLVGLIWAGGGLTALGGLLALFSPRAARSRRLPEPVPPREGSAA
ncbi:heme lyase CcmF/NrfE family subunit [Amycolatopsis thermoflava]|uniref:heme lyase CcmF/NrfE family subunit n=1 Tax=Amycolatopsis thermoflava TaxID=84480 RepID=UPI003EC04716